MKYVICSNAHYILINIVKSYDEPYCWRCAAAVANRHRRYKDFQTMHVVPNVPAPNVQIIIFNHDQGKDTTLNEQIWDGPTKPRQFPRDIKKLPHTTRYNRQAWGDSQKKVSVNNSLTKSFDGAESHCCQMM